MALKSKPLTKVRADVPLQEVRPVEEMVKLTFNVPKSTRQRWKAVAVHQNTTVTDLILKAMERHISLDD